MTALALIVAASLTTVAIASEPAPTTPRIDKLGTIECDVVEATPIVIGGRLYYFEAVRPDYKHKQEGVDGGYFRFWDVDSQSATPAFALGYHLGSAIHVGDTTFVFGVPAWGAARLHVFSSKDLKNWQSDVALDLPGWSIFNNSVCKAGQRYVMAFEINAPPEETGVAFTTRFAESKDLKTWKLLPPKYAYAKDRYTACPSIRFVDKWYYMTYLEAKPGPQYETYLVRSRDLVHWELSPNNPVLKFSEADHKTDSPRLTMDEKERIAKAVNLNNSDFDLCEFNGQTIILYSWGNQQGVEHLAHARYDGGLASFFRGWFGE